MRRMIALDSRISNEILENIKKIDNNILLIHQNKSFDDAVSSHPDMNILQIKDKIFTVASTDVRSQRMTKIELSQQGRLYYPNDVILNAVCIGNDFVCRKASVDHKALEYAVACGMRIIDVNQGYVKCNIVVVNELKKAIITEDAGIARVLTSAGYDVLKLETHDVRLDPYDYGFIGGASGNIDGKLLFTGDIKQHREYTKISDFCAKYGAEHVSLSNEPLVDHGSIIPIFCEDN